MKVTVYTNHANFEGRLIQGEHSTGYPEARRLSDALGLDPRECVMLYDVLVKSSGTAVRQQCAVIPVASVVGITTGESERYPRAIPVNEK